MPSPPKLLRSGKLFDLITHNIDTTIIGGVQLQSHRGIVFAVHFLCTSNNSGGLSYKDINGKVRKGSMRGQLL